MSFILDALKKLEQEKAARRGGNVNISDEIVRGPQRVSRTSKRTVPVSAVTIGVGFVLLILVVAVIILWRDRGVVRETESLTPDTYVQPREPMVAERASVPAAPRVQEAPPIRAAALPAPRTEPPPPPPQPRALRSETPAAPSPPAPVSERGGDSYQGGGSAGGNLTVSGIAWQDERSARRAVVNGVLLSEGKTVGGAKIVEIQPGRVRFSSNGRTFEVSLSSPLQGR
jgi:general secretion pathway protein B